MHIPSTEQLRIVLTNEENSVREMRALLDGRNIEILNIKMEIEDNGYLALDMTVKLPPHCKSMDLPELFQSCPYVKTIDI